MMYNYLVYMLYRIIQVLFIVYMLYRSIIVWMSHIHCTEFIFYFFFFQGTYTLSRKIVRNRAVSSYRIVCVCKKKKTCALSGI